MQGKGEAALRKGRKFLPNTILKDIIKVGKNFCSFLAALFHIPLPVL